MYTTTEAFVLKRHNLKEADIIVTLYTRDIGRIQAIARGVRKAKSKLAASLDIFTYIDLTLYRRHQNKLFTVIETHIKHSLYRIKKDFVRIVYGNYLLELVDKLTGEEKSISLFNLIKSFLFLMEDKDAETVLSCFMVRFLGILGYEMCLDVCASCRKPIHRFKKGKSWKISFSPKEGGVLCYRCRDVCNYRKDVSPGVIEIFKKFQRMDLNKINRLKFSDRMREEIKQSLSFLLFYYLPEGLKTEQFLEKVSRYRVASIG